MKALWNHHLKCLWLSMLMSGLMGGTLLTHAQSAPELMDAGKYKLAKLELAEALTHFHAVIQIDPQCAEAYLYRGLTWWRLGELERFHADMKQAGALDAALVIQFWKDHKRLPLTRAPGMPPPSSQADESAGFIHQSTPRIIHIQ